MIIPDINAVLKDPFTSRKLPPNVFAIASGSPEEVAERLRKRVSRTITSCVVLLDDEVFALVDNKNDTLFVRINPKMRHRIALPWRSDHDPFPGEI